MSAGASLRLSRQIEIINLLNSSHQGYTTSDLKNRFGVAKGTIERDLATIEEAGCPLYDESNDNNHRCYKFTRPNNLKPIPVQSQPAKLVVPSKCDIVFPLDGW